MSPPASPTHFLRPDVALEPLVDRWYAWSQLVSPATSALQLTRAQLPILDSFVANPAIHAAAVRNPKMRGGPFLDLDPGRKEDVAAFASELRAKRAHALAFVEALDALDALLDAEGGGGSLEPLYARIPEALRGFVELTYDRRHRAGFRLLERSLFASPLYAEDAQSVLVRRLEGDERSFVLSTPRLDAASVDGPDTLHLERGFRDPGLAALLRARFEAADPMELAAHLGCSPEVLAPFLTTDPPVRAQRFQGEGVRVRYFGHACLLIETREIAVLIDPLVGYASAEEPPRWTLNDLPERIDYVLITHAHQDHVVLETLLALRERIGTLIVPRANVGVVEDPSLAILLEALGFAGVRELGELERLEIPGGEVLGLPFLGEHGDLNIQTKLAHLVRLAGRAFVCSADSCNLEPRLYEHAREAAGTIDALFLGMECDGAPMSWLYGALLATPLKRSADQSRRLCGSDAEQGLAIVEHLAPEQVFVYAMGQEPWCRFITSIEYTPQSAPIVQSNELLERCRERGIAAERLYGTKDLVFAPR